MSGIQTAVDLRRGGFSWRSAGADRSGTPLVLLHGLTGSRWSWDPQVEAFGAERPVAAWDVPGYGDSDPLPGELSFAALGDAVAAFADVLGAERIHLAGLSFGGMIAQYAAVRHPQRIASLTLMSTSPKFGLDGTQPDEWRAARMAPLDEGLEPIDFAPRVMRAIAGPGISDAALDSQIRAASLVSSAGLRRSIEVLVTHDSRALLGSISAPTMCLVGALDDETPVAYSQAIADGVPGAVLHVVPGAGHLLNVEAPDAVNALLRSHIARTEEPT